MFKMFATKPAAPYVQAIQFDGTQEQAEEIIKAHDSLYYRKHGGSGYIVIEWYWRVSHGIVKKGEWLLLYGPTKEPAMKTSMVDYAHQA